MSETSPAMAPPAAAAAPPPRRWRLRCFIITLLLLSAAVFEWRVALFMVPGLERLVSDMMLGKDLYSPLTTFITEAARFQARHVFEILGVVLGAVALLWWRRGARWISMICVTLTALLALLSILAFPAMLHPTAMALHNIRVAQKKYPAAGSSREQLKHFLNPPPPK
jgi:hypothetical protein